MNYLLLVYLHLASVLPAFVLGTWLLLARKGTWLHKLLGRFYLVLMLITALITLLMPAQVGPTLLGHFGWLHLLSLLVLYSGPVAYFAAQRGDVKEHALNMLALYIGGIIIAGSFALMPGRLLHSWLF
ncbi:Uncharacterized membrane protein [Marinospirillum celere]|uniref:Uncharacterized membrane protein n=1 Tax=Marinospirillum celere TaxID=1122252 RepID=A0A1I1EW43_9GAMM|nr:DUF2306 domain-containing protein [Marinospirillum celere]SFB90912.1 Uncharacterized membrane protein [Marinospirillum celere]